ncbi:MAG: DMT family transporter [Lachnospiraceae bacterium]|nr:DMT family transporter [Lachnospiraceae bacterium]
MKNNLMLLLTALIWGCAFVAQSVGMDYVGPFTFNSVRCIIGSIVLIPVIFLMDALKKKSGMSKEEIRKERGDTKTLITGGICCGVVLGIASSLQQFGILFTSVGKAGFITAMYIVLVPILGMFLGRKIRPLIG